MGRPGETGVRPRCHWDIGAFSTALGFHTVVQVQVLSRTRGKKKHGLQTQATVPCLASLLTSPHPLGWE